MPTLPIALSDRALYGSSLTFPQHVTADIDFSAHLDLELLEKAVHAVITKFPVLKSTCDPVKGKCWRIHEDVHAKDFITAHDLRKNADTSLKAEEIVNRWLNTRIEVRDEMPFRVLVLRHDAHDRVLATIHHTAGDGRSLTIILEALHEAYNKISRQPDWMPDEDATPRSLRWLFSHYRGGWLWTLAKVLPRSLWRELTHPRSGGWVADTKNTGKQRHYIHITLPVDVMQELKKKAKEAGRTVNDVMLAAKGLAWRAMRMEQGLPEAGFIIGMLVNMRRDAGQDGRAVANFSSVEVLGVPKKYVASPDFARHIMDAAARVKKNKPGVHAIAPLLLMQSLIPSRWLTPRLENIWNYMARKNGAGCWFTNIGIIPDSMENWNGVTLNDMKVYVAATEPPTIIGSITTYKNRCNIVFGFVEGHLDARQQERLLALFQEKLREDIHTRLP